MIYSLLFCGDHQHFKYVFKSDSLLPVKPRLPPPSQQKEHWIQNQVMQKFRPSSANDKLCDLGHMT